MKTRSFSPIFAIGIAALAFAMAGCNMPGQTTAVSSSSGTSQSTPPFSGSGQGGYDPNPVPVAPSPTPIPASSGHVLNFQIGGNGICGQYGSLNQPCTSVTICEPGTSNCQTISDLLVDTGSYGLRVFSSAVSLSLSQLTDTSGTPLAECAQFGTGADWGPVVQANVQIAGESGVNMPIQLIDSAYAGGPPSVAVSQGCTGIDTSPQQAGFNGILGIGLFTQDCGPGCETDSSNGLYYSCNGTSCGGAKVALANQVVNPVSMLLADNNGIVFSLGSISDSGAGVLQGTVTLGIGTEADNIPLSSVKTYQANNTGNITTDFNGVSYPDSFIDSGSNGLFFPDTSIPSCDSSSAAPGWFCPSASPQALSATNTAAIGSTSGTVNFKIANTVTLVDTGNISFDDLGADSSASGFPDSFDWGLPFFYGTVVYVGISGAHSTLGTGPYWGY